MRILITNVYSYQNKGDAAIVIALINEIHRVFSKSKITIQTADPENDKGKYNVETTSSLLWILLSSLKHKNFLFQTSIFAFRLVNILIISIFYKLFKKRIRFLSDSLTNEFIDKYLKSNLIIACGGGYLRTESKSFKDSLFLFITCLNFYIGKLLGKKVYLYSQSIGPIHSNFQERILKFFLERVDVIEVREEFSLKLVKKLKINCPTYLTADAAFLLGNDFSKNSKSKTEFRVGITVRNWFKKKNELIKYEKSMADAIRYIIYKHDAKVFYLPQVIASSFDDDDRLVARDVEKMVNNKRFELITEDLHPNQMIKLCSGINFFIGTRMHSNIFALINEVPVIAVEYEYKTRGIMKNVGLENLTIPISEITFDKLKDKIDDIVLNRNQYKSRINRNLKKINKESSKAIEIIQNHYVGNIAAV